MRPSSFILILSIFIFSASFVSAATEVMVGSDSMNAGDNELVNSPNERLAMIVPALMVIVSIVFFAIDFGAIGVTASCLIGLVAVRIIGIVDINIASVTSAIIMGGILIYKISRG